MYPRLIPSILIRQGRLVKGRQYKNFRDAGAPATTARAHNYQSADELIVSDIEASKNNAEPDFETLRKVAEECFMPLTVFGGINSEERAAKCMEIGADKIGMTAAAYEKPELLEKLAHIYGAQAVVLGLDVVKKDGVYRLFDHRTGEARDGKSPVEWAKEAVSRGAGEIRVMAVSNEGTLAGFDFELYGLIRAAVNVPLVLEGGAGSLHHIEEAYKSGVAAVALGSMLVFSDANLVKIKQHMKTREIRIRT